MVSLSCPRTVFFYQPGDFRLGQPQEISINGVVVRDGRRGQIGRRAAVEAPADARQVPPDAVVGLQAGKIAAPTQMRIVEEP